MIFGRIAVRPDRECELHLAIYRAGFPYRATADPVAEAYLDEWVRGLEAGLESESSV